MKRICRVCGKEFEGHWSKTLCSKECEKKRKSEKNKEYQERLKSVHYGDDFKNSKSNIPKHNREARKKGVSYGYYMAMKDGRL